MCSRMCSKKERKRKQRMTCVIVQLEWIYANENRHVYNSKAVVCVFVYVLSVNWCANEINRIVLWYQKSNEISTNSRNLCFFFVYHWQPHMLCINNWNTANSQLNLFLLNINVKFCMRVHCNLTQLTLNVWIFIYRFEHKCH